MANPSVSVVVPAYNASRTLRQCLGALQKQDYRGSFEVIVVNDGSTDDTERIAKGFKGVKVLSQENAGPASARNKGAKAAKGEVIIFTDSDCVAKPDFVSKIVGPFADANVSGVQGAYVCDRTELMERFGQLEIEQRYEKMKRQKYIDFMGSYAAAYRKDVFLKFGGFDESFPVASGEDTDLSFRISSAGHKFVFAPEAHVCHFHPASLRKYLRIKFFRGYWRVLVYRKHSKKVLADSYTSQTIKLQMGLGYALALGIVLAITGAALRQIWLSGAAMQTGSFGGTGLALLSAQAAGLGGIVALVSALLLLASTLRFFLFALQRDAAVAFASIPIQLLRTFALCAGLAYGMVKAAMGRL